VDCEFFGSKCLPTHPRVLRQCQMRWWMRGQLSGHLRLGANLHLSCLVCWQQTLAVVVYSPPPPIKYRLHKVIPKLQQQ
jgi:hypothetical protein